MKYTLFLSIIALFFISNTQAQIEYPQTPKKEKIFKYHNTQVKDDYYWLESMKNVDVKNWVEEQNSFSLKFLNKLKNKYNIESEMNFLMYRNYDVVGEEMNHVNLKDKNYFKIFYTGYDSPTAIYFKKGTDGEYKKLVSNISIRKKGDVFFNYYKASKNENLLAYQYSLNNSDWKEIGIVQIKERKYFKDVVKNTKTSEIYWKGKGFFYKFYPFDSLTGKSILPKIKYHVVGTKQENDFLLYETKKEKEFISIFGSKDEENFFLKIEDFETKQYSYYHIETSGNLSLNPLLESIPYNIRLLKIINETVFAFVTIKNSKRLISFPKNSPKQWKFISPIYNNGVITDYEFFKDKIAISYQTLKSDVIAVIDYNGKVLGELATPEGMSVSGLRYLKEFEKFFFNMESFIVPNVSCKLNLVDYSYQIKGESIVNVDYKKYDFKREFITANDGTLIPICIVFKDSLKTDGSQPLLLKTYGGYGTITQQNFSGGINYFLENGGVFVYSYVRGGGELGPYWWKNGKNLNKKNTISDFINTAEYLIAKGYTSANKLAVTGGSHGGLVVAASVIQRPDLFGSAVIDKGVLDMLRFENFSVGATSTNLAEFGSVTNEEEFNNLYSYSPYHTIKNDVNYPPMLIITADSDYRVPPFHSYKFTAKLQERNAQKNPILLWTQEEASHSGANKIFDNLEENIYKYGFLLRMLK